jgi:hypothetical protein
MLISIQNHLALAVETPSSWYFCQAKIRGEGGTIDIANFQTRRHDGAQKLLRGAP